MNRENLIWLTLMLLGGGVLLVNAGVKYSQSGTVNGTVYVQEIVADTGPDTPPIVTYERTIASLRNEPGVSFSLSRTIGVWAAALCTLAVFSFLWGDNPLYKLAESVFVGVSAAYAMVVGFWTEIVQNLLGNLLPDLMRRTLLPGLQSTKTTEWEYIVPLILGVMMLWRLAPSGGWIARWPLAFFIGATAGIRLISYLESDFVQQINNTILPLVVLTADGTVDVWWSVKNVTIVFGVFVSLVYFFFSVEHTGTVGALARIGIWLLMITFGASFGYTVMGRVALLAARLEFLFDEWLWVIDPLQRRLGL
ncbi:hypothetical protein Mal4_41280 [Maioricimonas rarisocia]|uniref:Uncharacterized protein n=1 Tax=Maioricimonas rarisocia TaxID=2528026 RepID=A0A517ZBH2_9PLAN|nr:hypothetical protein [Maioricimonas rarisocia]QDU39781.1 hypothetical protein Mal4_41280 [Maioricimonas rarisocia]